MSFFAPSGAGKAFQNIPGLSNLSSNMGDAFNTFSNSPIGQVFRPLQNNLQQAFQQFGSRFQNPQSAPPQVQPQIPQSPQMPQGPAGYQQYMQDMIAALMRGRQ